MRLAHKVSYLQNSDRLQVQTEKDADQYNLLAYLSARIQLAIQLGMYLRHKCYFNDFLIIYIIINPLALAHGQVHSPL